MLDDWIFSCFLEKIQIFYFLGKPILEWFFSDSDWLQNAKFRMEKKISIFAFVGLHNRLRGCPSIVRLAAVARESAADWNRAAPRGCRGPGCAHDRHGQTRDAAGHVAVRAQAPGAVRSPRLGQDDDSVGRSPLPAGYGRRQCQLLFLYHSRTPHAHLRSLLRIQVFSHHNHDDFR